MENTNKSEVGTGPGQHQDPHWSPNTSQHILNLQKALAEAQSECAVARQALETCSHHDHSEGDDSDCACCAAIKAVMDTNCGASFLERLEAAEKQLNEAMLELDRQDTENMGLKSKLRAFESAMEREKKADWVKWHMDLADRLEGDARRDGITENEEKDLRSAARELRYMADSFTLKANFVPSELRIKELEGDCAVMREALEHYRPYHQGSPRIDKALSTDSGKALLAQLQAHQQALKEAKVFIDQSECGRKCCDGKFYMAFSSDIGGTSTERKRCEICEIKQALLTTIEKVIK